jgi:hypothetical protein
VAVTPAEEVTNIDIPENAQPMEDANVAMDVDNGGTPIAWPGAAEAPPREVGADPWQALAQVGAQFITALAAANDPDSARHPWIERDPASGAQSLKIPLPPPETARQLASALSALADSLRGRIG